MSFERDLDQVAARFALAGLDSEARTRLHDAAPVLRSAAPSAVASLHAQFLRFPETASFFTSEAQMARVAELQVQHLHELVAADLAPATVTRHHDVGVDHYRRGVGAPFFLGSVAMVLHEQLAALFDAEAPGTAAAAPPAAQAPPVAAESVRDTAADVAAVVLLDAGLVLEGYALELERAHALRSGSAGVAGAASRRTRVGKGAMPTRLTTADVEWRRTFLGIDDAVVAALAAVRPHLLAALPEVLDDFSGLLTSDSVPGRVVGDVPLDRLRAQAHDFWLELSEGRFDRPYAASRVRLGVVHERAGVSPQLYLAGVGRTLRGLVRSLPADHPELHTWVEALVRAVCFDATFVLDAYLNAREDRLLRTEGVAGELVRSMADAVVVVDSDDRVESADGQRSHYLRVEPSQLQRMPVGQALRIPGIELLVARARTADEHAVMLAESAGRSWRVTAIRIDTGDDARSRVAVVLSDVTDLLTAGGDLRDYQQRLDHLLRSVSATLWEVDLAARVVDFMTSPVANLTGYPDSHFIGRAEAWLQVVHPADLPRLRHLMRTLEPGGMAELEHRIIHADGDEVLVRTNLRRLDERPRIAGVTLDVRELQEERVRRQGAIGELAGGVAHELNNALSAVYGHLAMVGRIVHDPRAQRSIAAAEGAAARAADITARLLSFAGRQSLQPVPVDLNEIVAEVVPDGHWPGAQVVVEHRLAGDLGECVVDRERVASAIGELVVNALEAMAGRGSLVVSTCNVRGQHGDPDYVEVAVADTGRGMDAETLARAVEPFFTTKELGESSGLGLSTVFGFVTQSDGLLLLESVEGAGTIVRMRFPLDRSAAIEETISIRLDSSDVRVLVVDDDVMVREVTAQILSTLGLRVVAAGSADAALEVAQGTSFDFLVTDLALGAGADGARLIELLRSRRPGLGVVVMSGYPMSQLPFERLRGPFEYVAKPFTVDAIGRALRAVGWAGPTLG